MTKAKIKAWKKSAQGSKKTFNASIDVSGENPYPYACSFTSADGKTINFTNTETGETIYENTQRNVAVGKYTIGIVYTSSNEAKFRLILNDSYGSEIDLNPLTGTTVQYYSNLQVKYINYGFGSDYDVYLVSWLSVDTTPTGVAANFELLVFDSDGVLQAQTDVHDGDYVTTTQYAVLNDEPTIDYSDATYVKICVSGTRWNSGSLEYKSVDLYIQKSNAAFTKNTSSTITDEITSPTLTMSDAYHIGVEFDTPNYYLVYTTDYAWGSITRFAGPIDASDYEVIACDSTYVYAVKDSIIWKGTITSGTPDSISWSAIVGIGSYTLIGADANDNELLIVLQDTTYEYMVLLTELTNVYMNSADIIHRINNADSYCAIQCGNNAGLYDTIGAIELYDRNEDLVFKGYPLPSSKTTEIVLQGIDKELINRMCNVSYSAKTQAYMTGDLLDNCDIMEEGNNDLDDSNTYTQQWGSAVPTSIALETLSIFDASYYRTFVNSVDFYNIDSPSDSGKKIVWGKTTASLLDESANEIQQINKLVVFGAYSEDIDGSGTAGVIQITKEDTSEQALKGIQPIYIRRHDLETYDAVNAFATELWNQRKSSEDNVWVFKVMVYATTFFKAGDIIGIENGSLVSENMTDTDYFILKSEMDIVRNKAILTLCTSITPNVQVYNDILPMSAQTPAESATDATQGAQSTKFSLAELVGMLQSVLDRLDTLEA